MKLKFLLLFIICAFCASAQHKTFTEDELAAVVLKFHPLTKQANINVNIAKADILSSRGQFDPKLTSEAGSKEFSGTTYYDYRATGIQIPTWYGVDLYAGSEQMNGSRVNPEETEGSITYIGFSIQPLQNLLMDKRRAALLQAKNLHQLSETQRKIAINNLLRDALISYWDWWEKYQIHSTVKAALTNVKKRLAFVSTAFKLGDRAAIDTVEAYTQVQFFQIKVSETYQDLVEAQLELSAFLWMENGEPTQLPEEVVPQEYTELKLLALADLLTMAGVHPELQQYDFKLKGLRIEKRLAFQSLLPELKLRYNQTGNNLPRTLNATWFNNSYRYGISFSMPLRLSQGRGDYRKAQLNIEHTTLDLDNKRVDLFTKLKQFYTEWQQTAVQLSLQERLLVNTRMLQEGEELRFNNGEGSLFMINAREQKTIEAEQKIMELKAKARRSSISLRWSAGALVL